MPQPGLFLFLPSDFVSLHSWPRATAVISLTSLGTPHAGTPHAGTPHAAGRLLGRGRSREERVLSAAPAGRAALTAPPPPCAG